MTSPPGTGRGEEQLLLCVADVADTGAIRRAADVADMGPVVDLSAALPGDLLETPPADHVVIGVSGWAALRLLIPLTRHLTARRVTVVLQRSGAHKTPMPPWEPVRVGDHDGVRARLRRPRATSVHAVLTADIARPGDLRSAPARGLRVGVHGRVAEAWVAGDPHALHLAAADLAAAVTSDVAALGDVVVAGPSMAESLAALPEAPPVLRVDLRWEAGRGARGPSWSELATGGRKAMRWPAARTAAPAVVHDLHPLPPVDTGAVSPVGFRNSGVSDVARLVGESDDTLLITGSTGLVLEVHQGAPLGPEHLEPLRRLRAVRDTSLVHRGPLEHARLLVQLSAAGVPVIVDHLPEAVQALLGEELARMLAATNEIAVQDDFWREANSVAVRRVALRDHASRARWAEAAKLLPYRRSNEPTISVLLSTRRPENVAHALRQVALQRDVTAELVLALHGDDFDPIEVRRLAADAGLPVEVLQLPSSTRFGDVLNEATERCSGDLIAKMDDDDWYGPYHLWDLQAAMEYSGATLVGRPAEFIHLERIDVTVRRIRQGCERFAEDQVPGGGMMLRRDDLRTLGGWRPTSRAVDRFVSHQVRAAGGSVYRTHGFGFLVSRREEGHTWDSRTNRFLRGTVAQWRGVRLDMATADLRFVPTENQAESVG